MEERVPVACCGLWFLFFAEEVFVKFLSMSGRKQTLLTLILPAYVELHFMHSLFICVAPHCESATSRRPFPRAGEFMLGV